MPVTYERNSLKCGLKMRVLCNDVNGDPVYEEDGETRKATSSTIGFMVPDATDANITAAYTALAGLQMHTAQTPLITSEAEITAVDEG